MIKALRHQKILAEISRSKIAYIVAMGKMLEVSNDTIRRDIDELSRRGLLTAVRGGAIPTQHYHATFYERQNLNIKCKKVIAEKALKLIRPGQVIMIDAGTTIATLIEYLPRDIALTVITNSFPVAAILQAYPLVRLFFLGGEMNKHSFSTIGEETTQAVRNFTADICLLGVCSIDLNFGVTGADYQESLIKKAMIEKSKYVVALSTSDKIGHADAYHICKLTDVDMIVTEKDPAASDLLPYKALGLTIK